MANNVFTLLDNYQDKSIDTAVPSFLEDNMVVRYPLSLGKAQEGIPFTLFMPYKRKTDTKPRSTLGAASNADLFTSFPTPDFAIALPTPTSALKATYEAEYADVNLGQAAGLYTSALSGTGGQVMMNKLITASAAALAALAAVNIAADAVGLDNSNIKGGIAGVGAFGLETALLGPTLATDRLKLAMTQTILSMAGADEGAAEVLLGSTSNPFTDRLFKNVQFRTHNFNYTFLPKNEKESQEIDKIIQLFKYAMLPRPTSQTGGILGGDANLQGFFEFPYEFQITHSIQATTFTLLPSVLESMETDFGGGTDSLKLFKKTGGGKQYPTKITVSMTFKEMVLLNRDRIVNFREQMWDFVGPPDSNAKRYRF